MRFAKVLGLSVVLMSFAAAPAFAAATIARLAGDVQVVQKGKKQKAKAGARLKPGEGVRTGKRGKVRILMDDDSLVLLGPRSHMTIKAFKRTKKARQFELDMKEGRFKLDVSKDLLRKTSGKVGTPTAIVGIRSTIVWGDTELDAVCALEGEVELTAIASGASENLSAGNCRTKMAEGKLEVIEPTGEQLAGFLAQFEFD